MPHRIEQRRRVEDQIRHYERALADIPPDPASDVPRMARHSGGTPRGTRPAASGGRVVTAPVPTPGPTPRRNRMPHRIEQRRRVEDQIRHYERALDSGPHRLGVEGGEFGAGAGDQPRVLKLKGAAVGTGFTIRCVNPCRRLGRHQGETGCRIASNSAAVSRTRSASDVPRMARHSGGTPRGTRPAASGGRVVTAKVTNGGPRGYGRF
jgi:hypothetical protein